MGQRQERAAEVKDTRRRGTSFEARVVLVAVGPWTNVPVALCNLIIWLLPSLLPGSGHSLDISKFRRFVLFFYGTLLKGVRH